MNEYYCRPKNKNQLEVYVVNFFSMKSIKFYFGLKFTYFYRNFKPTWRKFEIPLKLVSFFLTRKSSSSKLPLLT